MELLMTVSQFAELIGVSRWQVYNLIESGVIKPTISAPVILIDRSQAKAASKRPGKGRPITKPKKGKGK